MISKKDKNADRKVRHARVRKNLSGTSLRPRLRLVPDKFFLTLA